jgi:hypothetical protein
MPIVNCVIVEWGWQFLLFSVLGILVVAIILAWIIRLFVRNRSTQNVEFGFGKILAKFSESFAARLISAAVVLAIVGGVIWLVYSKFEDFETKYSVAMDAQAVPVTLEEIRQKYRGDTQATIIIADRAKQFSVKGEYEGACVADFIESICREYPSQLSCLISLSERKVSVDMK